MPPTPLIGGAPNTQVMNRHFPDIATDRQEGYAKLITHNFDYLQESYNLEVKSELENRLEDGKRKAQEKYDDVGMTFNFGGEVMQIQPKGTKGKSWVLKNDDFFIMIGRGAKEWKVAVRYTAAGLWEYGILPLKQRVLKCLLLEMRPNGEGVEVDKPKTWQRLSRFDYAMDFYSPKFSMEMVSGNIREKMVLPSGVKGGIVFDSNKDETITLGFNKSGLQIQIYNKGKQLSDVKGDSWLWKVYEREGFYPNSELEKFNIWRFECRFGKEFTKDRGLLTIEDAIEAIRELLCEAIGKRRIGEPNGDQNKARWPLHPLYAEMFHNIDAAGHYLPMGRLTTLKKEVKQEMIKKQISGCIRSHQILKEGEYDHWEAYKLGQDCAMDATEDENHETKVEKAKEKYKYEGEAE